MERLLLLIVTLLTIGCYKEMTNDEIISEAAKCQQAGMKAELYTNGWTGSPIQVVCYPVNVEVVK